VCASLSIRARARALPLSSSLLNEVNHATELTRGLVFKKKKFRFWLRTRRGFWVRLYGAHAARLRTRTHHLHAVNDEEGHSHPVQIILAKPELPHCCPADTHMNICKKRKRERERDRGIYI